jgi:hypothetical protein
MSHSTNTEVLSREEMDALDQIAIQEALNDFSDIPDVAIPPYSASEHPEESIFHEKGVFKLHGYSMYELLLAEIPFKRNPTFKRCVHRFDLPDIVDNQLSERPLVIDIKKRIETTYGVKIRGAFANLYENGDDYAPYHKDSYQGVSGIFTASFGAMRDFYTKNDHTNEVKKYSLGDGDLLYFNSEFNKAHKHMIPKHKYLKDGRISIVYFA